MCCHVSSSGEFVQLFSGKAKQFKWNHKFQPGSHAHFRLRARNAIGWSEDSREAAFSALQAAPPAPLHPSLSSSTPHSLTLHWAPPTEAASITAYCLEMDDPHSVSLSPSPLSPWLPALPLLQLPCLCCPGLRVLSSLPGRRAVLHLP